MTTFNNIEEFHEKFIELMNELPTIEKLEVKSTQFLMTATYWREKEEIKVKTLHYSM